MGTDGDGDKLSLHVNVEFIPVALCICHQLAVCVLCSVCNGGGSVCSLLLFTVTTSLSAANTAMDRLS